MFLRVLLNYLFFIVIFISIQGYLSANNSDKPVAIESITINNDRVTAISDTLSTKNRQSIQDTIPPNIPLRSHGSLFHLPSPITKITKHEIQYFNFSGLHDILSQKIKGLYPLHLGGYGQVNGLSLFGSGLRDASLQYNARSMNEGIYGAVNIEEYPPEMIEQLEIFTGSDAIIYSGNSSGILINIQERIFNSKTPFTHLWYSQGGYDYIASDGILSQNIAKNWNTTIGYRRQTSSSRYVNSKLDLWNVRANIRWSPNNETTFTLSELFTHRRSGTNGGIDTSSPSIGNELLATSVYSDLSERVFRHDLTLTGTSNLSVDTSSYLSGTLFYTNAVWQKFRPIAMSVIPGDTFSLVESRSLRIGSILRYEQKILTFATLKIGGELEFQSVDRSVYNEPVKNVLASSYGHLYQKYSDKLSLKGGIRVALQNGVLFPSIGAAIEIVSLDNLTLSFDVSQSSRAPSASEGLGLTMEKHLLTIAKVQYLRDSLSIGIIGFARIINSPILSEAVRDSVGFILTTRGYNGNTREIFGVTIDAKLSIGKLSTSAFLQLYQSTDANVSNKRFPFYYGGISAQYEYSVGQSVMFGGLTLKLIGSHTVDEFIPQTWSSISSRAEPSNNSFNGVDAFIVFRLGNAFVRATYFNLFSQTYYYVSVYPQLDRNLRLSVSWSFFD